MVPGFEREFDYRCKEVDIAPGCNPVMAPGSKPVPFWCDEHVSRELVTACLPAFPHRGIFRDILRFTKRRSLLDVLRLGPIF